MPRPFGPRNDRIGTLPPAGPALSPSWEKELLYEYKVRIGAKDLPDEQVLKARGFIKNVDNREYLSHAAVLLFAYKRREKVK